MRQTRNLLYGLPYRGFESLPLRQIKSLRALGNELPDAKLTC